MTRTHDIALSSVPRAVRRAVAAVVALTVLALPAGVGFADTGDADTGHSDTGDAALVTLESRTGEAKGGARPTVSEDGRFVAFVGPRPSEDGTTTTAFLRDRSTSSAVDLLPAAVGRRDGDTAYAVVSSDGCSITVTTQIALDLFDDDDEDERWDVYRVAAPRCRWGDVGDLDWELVSAADDGRARNDVDPTYAPSVSASGVVVAYTVPVARRSDLRRVMVTDLGLAVGDPGRTTPVPGLPSERPTDGIEHIGHVDPSVSGDGGVVVFTSDAHADAAEVTWSTSDSDDRSPVTQVYAWNRADGTTTRVSSGRQGSASQPSVSYDGTTIAFVATSQRTELAQVHIRRADGDGDGTADDPAVELVSRSLVSDTGRLGVGANGASWRPSLSADGTTVAFMTRASDLVPGRIRFGSSNTDGDVVIADLVHGGIRRAVTGSAGVAIAAHASVMLSASGRLAVFDTDAPGAVVPGSGGTGRQVVAVRFPVEASMPALDLGTVAVDQRSVEWFVTVSNTGSSTFLPRVVRTTDPQFVVVGESCVGARVVPGGSCTVRVVFVPSGAAEVLAELIVAETGFDAVTVSTPMLGSRGEPTLSATPAGVGLPDTVVGETSAPSSIELRNVTASPTTVDEVSLRGNGDVVVESDDCTGRVLFPDETCVVTVAFTPVEAGMRAALLRFIASSGSRTSVVLTGVAEHHPEVVSEERVQAGRTVDVLAWGYPPGADLQVSWLSGRGPVVEATTDDRGELLAKLPLHRREPPGERTLVVSDPRGVLPAVAWPLRVLPAR